MARVALSVLVALALAPAGLAAPPRAGVLVPGRTLGGLALGSTRDDVRAAWGARHGICRDCRARTWYFTYRRFAPQGVGVTFRNGLVTALFTLWSPPAWRTSRGLRIGDPSARVTARHGVLPRTQCAGYEALTILSRRATSAIYVVDGKVWAFALLRRGDAVCR